MPSDMSPPLYAGDTAHTIEARTVWAWYQPQPDAPGFENITYTEAAGMSFVDPAGGDINVTPGRFLFRVP